MDVKGFLGAKGRLGIRVIRAKPSRRQRIEDKIGALKRRLRPPR